jgi:dihydroxyacetone kinase-like predicted kinase
MAQPHTVDLDAFGPDDIMTYGYCTELLLRLQSSKVDLDTFDESVIPAYLSTIGDSVVSFRTGSIVKIHVHTKTPEKVLEYGRQFGEFLTVKIENMSLQHNESIEEQQPAAAPVSTEKKKYGIVAVCSGEGIEAVFKELGTDVIVSGGQTQNPSTSDFLDAFERISAEHIFVFPNNGNILLAARQAADIYEGATIHVIESKDLGAGYVAIASMDLSEDNVDVILEGAREAMSRATTGTISPAIRDAELDGVQIHDGDFIGFVGKRMLVSEPELTAATVALCDKMLEGGDKFMLSIFTGKAATEQDTAAIEAQLKATHGDVEVYFIEGSQDVYPYIIIAE